MFLKILWKMEHLLPKEQLENMENGAFVPKEANAPFTMIFSNT